MYRGYSTDIRIRTDDYNKFKETYGVVCIPKLKNGRVHSFKDVECADQYMSVSALMRLLIGQSVVMNLSFGEEDGKTFVDVYQSSDSNRLYKVSNSTRDPGSVNITLIIIIVVVVIIILIVVLVLVFASKKKQKAKKLPTKTVSDKSVEGIAMPAVPAKTTFVEATPIIPVHVDEVPTQPTSNVSTQPAPVNVNVP